MHPIAILHTVKSFITFNRSTPVVRRWRNFLSCLSRHFGKCPGLRLRRVATRPEWGFLARPFREDRATAASRTIRPVEITRPRPALPMPTHDTDWESFLPCAYI